MKIKLDETRPIFLQIKEYIEDSIINKTMQPGERVPSTNEFANFFKINPATAAKGVNELVAEEIIMKRRGVGMFVAEDGREILLGKRKESFFKNYMLPLKTEAEKLEISENELYEMIKRAGGIIED